MTIYQKSVKILPKSKVYFFMIEYHAENSGKFKEYRTKPHENWVIPPHLHEFSEIAYVYEGELTVYINDKKYIVPKNHLIMILPNRVHEYSDETPSKIQCAVFSNDLIPAFFDKIGDFDLENPVVDFSEQTWLLNDLARVRWDNLIKITGLLYLVLDRVLSQTQISEIEIKEQIIYKSAIRIISQSFTEDITLKDLAKKLGYHEKYLSSALHSLTKMNFREFLASYRINHAKRLLKSKEGKDLRIIDVALKSGFSSINTFNRVFKENTGKTPLQYKKEK